MLKPAEQMYENRKIENSAVYWLVHGEQCNCMLANTGYFDWKEKKGFKLSSASLLKPPYIFSKQVIWG